MYTGIHPPPNSPPIQTAAWRWAERPPENSSAQVPQENTGRRQLAVSREGSSQQTPHLLTGWSQTPQTWNLFLNNRNKCVLLNPPSLWYFVMAMHASWDLWHEWDLGDVCYGSTASSILTDTASKATVLTIGLHCLFTTTENVFMSTKELQTSFC